MRKKILFIFALLLIIPKVNALMYGNCDVSTLSRLKAYVKNVNISYSYRIDNEVAYFDVILTNLVPGIYFVDSKSQRTYTYNNTVNGEITIRNYVGNTEEYGTYKFYVDDDVCRNSLGTKYYKFPVYNTYYRDVLCSDIPNYKLCQRWINESIDYEKFKHMVTEYKKELERNKPIIEETQNKTFLDILLDFYIRNYYYLLIAIILVCVITIYVKQKNNKFKL